MAIIKEKIVKRDNKYIVMSSDGKKILGTHNTEEDAKKQLKAVEINKEKLNKLYKNVVRG